MNATELFGRDVQVTLNVLANRWKKYLLFGENQELFYMRMNHAIGEIEEYFGIEDIEWDVGKNKRGDVFVVVMRILVGRRNDG